MPVVRRYQDRRHDVQMSSSTATLPGLVILGLGIVVLLTGIIMLAAFGIPDNIDEEPRQLAPPIIISIGTIMCLIGIIYAMYLNKKDKAERALRKTTHSSAQVS